MSPLAVQQTLRLVYLLDVCVTRDNKKKMLRDFKAVSHSRSFGRQPRRPNKVDAIAVRDPPSTYFYLSVEKWRAFIKLK